jgi:hypothetical protein
MGTDGTRNKHTSREITASNSLFSFTSASAYKQFPYKQRNQSLRYPNSLSWKGNVHPL